MRMRMQRYNSTKATIKTIEAVFKGVQNHKSIKSIRQDLSRLVASFNGLNKYERAHLVSVGVSVAKKAKANFPRADEYLSQRTVYNQLDVAARKVAASQQLRQKRQLVRNELQSGEHIFFLCSYHSNPADDHKDFQGKIYVNRYWRSMVTGTDYYKVASYIKNRNVQTIQSIMGAPVYLTTRRYCRHYFTPLSTEAVLTSSPKALLHNTKSFHYSQRPRPDIYYNTRAMVYDDLANKFGNDAFKSMASMSMVKKNKIN